MTDFSELTKQQCQSARLSRDSRFDGHFYTAVKTTGIFCRPICPANPPHEKNVEYFASQAQALLSGYRPCLRCRPDSAPGSYAWKGVETTFGRALKLIDDGDIQSGNLSNLATRLGISDRYLRKLFQDYLGMSPKQYGQYQQLMFAKQLLHTSNMTVTDIAFASGFNSIRRFNDAFQKKLKLTPSEVRKASKIDDTGTTGVLKKQLKLSYRPPFNWQYLLEFYRKHALNGIERIGEDDYYRSVIGDAYKGWFRAHLGSNNTLLVEFEIDDITQLRQLVAQIRRLFDLDADIVRIEQHLKQTAIAPLMSTGLRIPGAWDPWEAGVRAIFGQQISLAAAVTLLNGFIKTLNHNPQPIQYFPSPAAIANADFNLLKMVNSRKDTLKRFAIYMVDHFDNPPDDWIDLKGIGPWTIDYAKIRGLCEPDRFLSTDLVIKKALAKLDPSPQTQDMKRLIADLSPWGSYATFNCWDSQS